MMVINNVLRLIDNVMFDQSKKLSRATTKDPGSHGTTICSCGCNGPDNNAHQQNKNDIFFIHFDKIIIISTNVIIIIKTNETMNNI